MLSGPFKGNNFFAGGEFNGAMRCYSKALSDEDDYDPAIEGMVKALCETGRMEEAIEFIKNNSGDWSPLHIAVRNRK